jgi:UDP-glucose 4-epimerase
MRVVVTGGAGFIGSNLVDALLSDGHHVVVVDNFSTGVVDNLHRATQTRRCQIVEGDLLDTTLVADAVRGADAVFHLAANADVRFGWNHPWRDLEQNVAATINVLEAARASDVRRVLFSSTGSVYGEAQVIPTLEDAAFPQQTSLYGASKLAAEGYLGAYAEAGHLSVTVFRFVSVLGPRYSHGHVIDFVRQLARDPARLHILGDGTQRKSYLDVDDCVAAMRLCLPRDPRFEVFNLGVDSYCTTTESATWICERMGAKPEVRFGGGDRGWIGDNPFIFLDTTRIRSLGWAHRRSIREAVERTVDDLLAHPARLDAPAEDRAAASEI